MRHISVITHKQSDFPQPLNVNTYFHLYPLHVKRLSCIYKIFDTEKIYCLIYVLVSDIIIFIIFGEVLQNEFTNIKMTINRRQM